MANKINKTDTFIKIYSYSHDTEDYIVNHSHNFCELCYYSTGSGVTNISSQVYYHSAGSIIFTPPKFIHDDLCIDEQIVYCLQFNNYDLKEPLNILPNNTNKLIIDKITSSIIDLDNNKSNLSKEYIEEKTNHIVYLFTTLQQDIINKKTHYSVLCNYIKSYLYRNWNKHPNYIKLCEEYCFYSWSRIRHIFKDQEGISISQYHTNLRMRKIRELLITTNNSLSSIAQKSGFSNNPQFAKYFKLYQGITPNEYRKSYASENAHHIIKHTKLKEKQQSYD